VTLKYSLATTLVLLAVGVAVLYVILNRAVHAPPPSLAHFRRETPQALPQVSFVDATGAVHQLADFKGRYVVLNLWATWCGPCVQELPRLVRLSREIDADRMVVVAVAIPPGSLASAKAFLAAHNAIRLAPYFDSRTMFVRSFHAYGLPLTVLVDPGGREVGRAFGAEEWDAPDASAYLKEIMRGQ
jgi:thiol-disulfide isomerase/thioredoxin